MANLIFHRSSELTLGVELELQLINPKNQEFISRAKELIRNISNSEYKELIKPEVTQSMIELNSSIHTTPQSVNEELLKLADFLIAEGKQLGVNFCGGGTHPFESWSERKIFPTPRFKTLSNQYRYLSKRSTVFGLHIHVGCKNGNDAIYLTHLMYRYAPHFIALSASSPFYQGVDTGYHSARINIFNVFPTSGMAPFKINWKEFSDYYLKMRKLKIIRSMKDFYWDIRPKPKFGTVEIRICDAPLTIMNVAIITAYAQSLARYLLIEKPLPFTQDLYMVYNYNRFQASRYGFNANFIDPYTLQHRPLHEDLIATLEAIKPHADALHNNQYLSKIRSWVTHKQNDATRLRAIFSKTKSLEKVIEKQCELWLEQFPNR